MLYFVKVASFYIYIYLTLRLFSFLTRTYALFRQKEVHKYILFPHRNLAKKQCFIAKTKLFPLSTFQKAIIISCAVSESPSSFVRRNTGNKHQRKVLYLTCPYLFFRLQYPHPSRENSGGQKPFFPCSMQFLLFLCFPVPLSCSHR